MRAKPALTYVAAMFFLVGGMFTGALVAQGRSLSLLDRLTAGKWEFRAHDGSSAPRTMCLGDARRLIQLRHPGQSCNQVVVDDTANQVTVQYTCPGHGYGRTVIRRESDSLIQIDTQGIAGGLPFAFGLEGRQVGSCRG